MLTESREAISLEAFARLGKSPQIPAIASLSSPQLDANPFSVGSDNVRDLRALIHVAGVSQRWRWTCGYGNLRDIRIKLSDRAGLPRDEILPWT
jgi:hypothetical protein